MNSILQIKVTQAVYDFTKPYQKFREIEVTGSGFVIDSSIVLTTFNLVENSLNITGRCRKSGNKDISLELIGYCREKNLALCKIQSDFLKTEALKLSDSLEVNTGDKIYSLEPYNAGFVSGFNYEQIYLEDSLSRSPVYMEATYPSIIGNAVFNSKNEVIGISEGSKLKTQIIPSRTILAVYGEMINSFAVKMPTFSLDWSCTNREIMKKQTGTSSTYGIYVRKISPDSCLDRLEKRDVIRRIDYIDPFTKSFSISQCGKFEEGTLVTVFLDRFGMSTTIGQLKNPDEIDENKLEFVSKYTDRKLHLSEIVDSIPIGTELTLNMCRDRNWYKLKTPYVHRASERLDYLCPKFFPFEYHIFSGLCLTNLYDNHSLYKNDENNDKYKNQVVIAKIFEGSYAYKTQSLMEGQIIKSIYGYDSNFELIKETHKVISSLEDVKSILKIKPDYVQITTTEDYTFINSLTDALKEDTEIKDNFELSF
tara:strand:- start:293 stop:1732 length:1440 start_codon:yes stop_codon:yes gene_type:complete